MADASKKVNIGITTTADTAGADKAAKSIQKIGDASSKASKEAEKQARNTAYSIGNVGNQIQDVAVQIESGTSALRIFSQQAPQIAGAFGPYGAIGGALLALGALAYKTFSGMSENALSSAASLEYLKEVTSEVLKISGEFTKAELDFGFKQIQSATTQANLLATAFDQTKTSAAAFTTSAAANLETVRKAMIELRRASGEQVDEVQNIKDTEAAQSAARQDQAQKQIQAQRDREAAAQRIIDNANNELLAVAAISAKKQEELATEEQRLQAAKDALKVIESQRTILDTMENAKLSAGDLVGFGVQKALNAKPREVLDQNQATQESIIAQVQSKVDSLTQALGVTGQITSKVIEAANAVTEAQIKGNDTIQSAGIEIQRISEAFNADEIKAQAQNIAEQQKGVAVEINTALASIQPTTDQQKAALEQVNALTSDNRLTSNELLAATSGLSNLARALPASATGQKDMINQLIQLVSRLQADQNESRAAINKISAQKTIPLRTS